LVRCRCSRGCNPGRCAGAFSDFTGLRLRGSVGAALVACFSPLKRLPRSAATALSGCNSQRPLSRLPGIYPGYSSPLAQERLQLRLPKARQPLRNAPLQVIHRLAWAALDEADMPASGVQLEL